MRDIPRVKLIVACAACFFVGWLSGPRGPLTASADPLAPKKAGAPVFSMQARLGANLYLQRSAEYRACCYGIYRSAALRLEALLQAAHPRPANPAVVMDLDETVFDNSAFETFLYQNNLEYTDALWADYEENHPQDVGLIPGAKQFIQKAESLGVTVVFLSNRSKAFQNSTRSALQRLGVLKPGVKGRLYLAPVPAAGEAIDKADKSARREQVAAKYNVLMLFGDNLRDFSEVFKAPKPSRDARPADLLNAIRQRTALAEEARVHWGIDWFVLPNPVYGEWEMLIGTDPIAILQPTTMKKQGLRPK